MKKNIITVLVVLGAVAVIAFILNNNKAFGIFLDYTQYGLIVQYKSENLLIQPEDVISIYIDKQE